MKLPRRALVTGGAGFIGSHLAVRLAAEGTAVRVLDDFSAASASLPDTALIEVYRGNVLDASVVSKFMEGCDTVFHLAASRSVQRSISHPQETVSANVLGTVNVLEAARVRETRVVYSSSSSVYGDQTRFPLTEGMVPLPKSPYAASKYAGEVMCQAWHRTFGLPTVALRYFNVYGPGQEPGSQYAAVIPLFVTACLEGLRPEIHGDGQQSRDFTYVDDVVEANIRAAAREDVSGVVLNVGGGRKPTPIVDLLEIIAGLVGVSPEPEWTDPRAGDIQRSEADVSAARAVIGYEPRYDIVEGLRRTVDWHVSGGQPFCLPLGEEEP